MEFKDYYKILNVKPDADSKEIKTAYRKLARKYHPDMNPDEGAEDKFKEVAEAYEVLKNTERRTEFDELRKYGSEPGKGFEPPPGWQREGESSQQTGRQFEGDFSEFFNSMFGGSSHGFRHTGSYERGDSRGADVEIEMPVFLEETVTESVRTVEYRIPGHGEGKSKDIQKHLKVKIPVGVIDGERIRLKGQGSPGLGDGAAGDLYLHIRLVPHPLFDVQGQNLILTLPISPWEAALGTKVTVPTLEGKINLTIMPNSQTGTKMRVKGKGLKGKTITGDLYAVVKIVIPPVASERQIHLWSELSESEDFDPRIEWSNSK